jgi:hypothetical protein
MVAAMSHPSPHPVRGWRVPAVAGPSVWVLVGLIPTIWGWRIVERYAEHGPALSLFVGLALTIVIEAIALPTLAITAWNPTSRVLRALALLGNVALVFVSLLVWTVVTVDRPVDVVSLAALTAVSVTSAVAWVRSRTASRSGRVSDVELTPGRGGG